MPILYPWSSLWRCLRSGRAAIAIGFALSLALRSSSSAVLDASDVVFMYEGSRETYEAYGATVLAWGGRPSPESLQKARGVRFFGSVGMVTEFAEFHRRVGDRYEEALCRDPEGKPVRVPWLTDHQSGGVPFWWCCTAQPLFRQYLRDRVAETIKAGAHGLHVDDHLGTAGGLWLGLCFCDRCVAGFRDYLRTLDRDEWVRFGVTSPDAFDFRSTVRTWLAAPLSDERRKVTGHPLWTHWTIFHCRAAAALMLELRELAAQTAGHAVPVGANAGLLWPRHLADYRAIDLFTAETDHHASGLKCSVRPIFAYRLAEAMGRPYAATASGGDWAFIKERGLPGLVRTWVALSYAGGQRLMAPHHQWCYTPAKGTHWYDGPAGKFAPLYRFVGTHAATFDGLQTHADLVVVLPHRSFLKNPERWFDIADRLASTNVSYRLLVAADEIVDRPLDPAELRTAKYVLAPEREEFLKADRERFEARSKLPGVFATLDEALSAVRPAVRLAKPEQAAAVRVLPRTGAGRAVVHLLNFDYDAARDDVRSAEKVEVRLDFGALGIVPGSTAKLLRPGEAEPEIEIDIEVHGDRVVIPRLGLWGMLTLSAH